MTRARKGYGSKHIKFNRNWKRIFKERENKIQDELKKQFSNNFSDPEYKDEVQNQTHSFEYRLKHWSITFGISMNALDALLDILKANGHQNLPKSYRTLLGTPRNIEIVDNGDAKYWYRGVAECLRVVFSKISRDLCIELKINMDGLPIFNSSKFQYWPILASIHGKLGCSSEQQTNKL